MKETLNRQRSPHLKMVDLRRVSEESRLISRATTKANAKVFPLNLDQQGLLTYSMQDCYTKLKDLVPSIPKNKKVGKVELLQHVIDYINELQVELNDHPGMANAAAVLPFLNHRLPPVTANNLSRIPLGSLQQSNTYGGGDTEHSEGANRQLESGSESLTKRPSSCTC